MEGSCYYVTNKPFLSNFSSQNIQIGNYRARSIEDFFENNSSTIPQDTSSVANLGYFPSAPSSPIFLENGRNRFTQNLSTKTPEHQQIHRNNSLSPYESLSYLHYERENSRNVDIGTGITSNRPTDAMQYSDSSFVPIDHAKRLELLNDYSATEKLYKGNCFRWDMPSRNPFVQACTDSTPGTRNSYLCNQSVEVGPVNYFQRTPDSANRHSTLSPVLLRSSSSSRTQRISDCTCSSVLESSPGFHVGSPLSSQTSCMLYNKINRRSSCSGSSFLIQSQKKKGHDLPNSQNATVNIPERNSCGMHWPVGMLQDCPHNSNGGFFFKKTRKHFKSRKDNYCEKKMLTLEPFENGEQRMHPADTSEKNAIPQKSYGELSESSSKEEHPFATNCDYSSTLSIYPASFCLPLKTQETCAKSNEISHKSFLEQRLHSAGNQISPVETTLDSKCSVPGVYLDSQKRLWRAQWREPGAPGKRKSRSFPVVSLGFWSAKAEAVELILEKNHFKEKSKCIECPLRKIQFTTPEAFVRAVEDIFNCTDSRKKRRFSQNSSSATVCLDDSPAKSKNTR